MPDITVTPELASIIKRERANATPRLSAKDLSKDIGKSETYISTLERGNIKKIEQDTFVEIFKKIKNVPAKEFNEYLENILKDGLANIELTDKELEKQKWMSQLNLIIREIPIVQSIIDFIKNSLDELGKNELDLTEKINENTYFEDQEKYDFNKLYVDNNGGCSYRFKLDNNIIPDILNKKIKFINYITMLGITYNIYLLKGENNEIAMKNSKDFLQKHKFYDLDEVEKARQQYSNKETNKNLDDEYSLELPKYEQDFDKSLKEIKKYINRLRNIKIDKAFRIVKVTESNVQTDPSFMNAIYSIPFGLLFENLTKEEKQEFITKLSQLIKETSEKSNLPQAKDDEYTTLD